MFLDYYTVPYDIPNHLLADNGFQFVRLTFGKLHEVFWRKHSTSTAYGFQTNGKAERYNNEIFIRLRHYVTKHMDDWKIFVQPLTYRVPRRFIDPKVYSRSVQYCQYICLEPQHWFSDFGDSSGLIRRCLSTHIVQLTLAETETYTRNRCQAIDCRGGAKNIFLINADARH